MRSGDEPLRIGGEELGSRLLLGSGGFANPALLAESVVAAGAEIATVAVRRADHAPGGILEAIRGAGARVLPNTAGCRTARDAVTTAQLAREALRPTG